MFEETYFLAFVGASDINQQVFCCNVIYKDCMFASGAVQAGGAPPVSGGRLGSPGTQGRAGVNSGWQRPGDH